MKALSIRQPWAWLIANGFKDIENRDWPTKFRGAFLIHAGMTMTKDDYAACMIFIAGITRTKRVPAFDILKQQCGGIVGVATITDCTESSDSFWFTGQFGFVIEKGCPLPFKKCKGALGFFNVIDINQPSTKG